MARTNFRKTLIRELGDLARSREIDDRFVEIVHVEDKRHLLSEFSGFYADDLLAYGPFADEFEPGEIEAIRQFVDLARAGLTRDAAWSELRRGAADLLRRLGGVSGDEPGSC